MVGYAIKEISLWCLQNALMPFFVNYFYEPGCVWVFFNKNKNLINDSTSQKVFFEKMLRTFFRASTNFAYIYELTYLKIQYYMRNTEKPQVKKSNRFRFYLIEFLINILLFCAQEPFVYCRIGADLSLIFALWLITHLGSKCDLFTVCYSIYFNLFYNPLFYLYVSRWVSKTKVFEHLFN